MADDKIVQEPAADDILNQAAEDAIAVEPVEPTEPTEPVDPSAEPTEPVEPVEPADPVEPVDPEGLPADHAKRSDLGRKLSAIHRRQDDEEQLRKATDVRLEKILSVLETQAERAEPDPLDDLDPDEPITMRELDKRLDAREKKATQQTETYNTTYFKSLNTLIDGLDEGERDAVIEELKVLPYDPSNSPDRDAQANFGKAERTYLRKRLAGPKDKKNPVTGKHEHSAIGTVTNQKVVTKETTLPKLDAAGMSYLAFVESEDGSDKAQELHKSIGKG